MKRTLFFLPVISIVLLGCNYLSFEETNNYAETYCLSRLAGRNHSDAHAAATIASKTVSDRGKGALISQSIAEEINAICPEMFPSSQDIFGNVIR